LSTEKLYSIVTTIQAPTRSMRGLARTLRHARAELLVLGDRKGPQEYALPGTELFTLDRQTALPFSLLPLLPVNHYVRKNAGYLLAVARGAGCIYETDDDNEPLASWTPRNLTIRARVVSGPRWCNAYRHFSDDLIWPRGFPLDQIRSRVAVKLPGAKRMSTVESPIQQGLADLSPDVDALWRLVLDRDIRFKAADSIALKPGIWCPFNSQSTWWWPHAYPLMYLPSFCTFRMTDIWRSFVAQRCLWEMGGMLSFHAAEAIQRRNQHNLMRDFADEIPGYMRNDEIVKALEDVSLERGADAASDNLIRCYEALIRCEVFPAKELRLVRAWVKDLAGIRRGKFSSI
jgi:hypothetical protein